MLYIKKTAKIVGLSVLSIVLLVGMYLLAASTLSKISVAREQSAEEIPVYILTNGVHTDLVLPLMTDQMDWSKEVKFENTVSKDTSAKYIAIGWGDKGFYLDTPTWDDLTFATAFKAAFRLSTSAIHATFYKSMKEDESCKKIMISKQQYARLIIYIKNSFATDANEHAIYINTNANYGNTDAFYEGNGKYSLFQTCNTWANDGLKSCGQKACVWTPFDTGIFYQYNQNE